MITVEQFVDRHCRGKWLPGKKGGFWLPLKPTIFRVVAWQEPGGLYGSKLVDGKGLEIPAKHKRPSLEEITPHAARLAHKLTWPNVLSLEDRRRA